MFTSALRRGGRGDNNEVVLALTWERGHRGQDDNCRAHSVMQEQGVLGYMRERARINSFPNVVFLFTLRLSKSRSCGAHRKLHAGAVQQLKMCASDT